MLMAAPRHMRWNKNPLLYSTRRTNRNGIHERLGTADDDESFARVGDGVEVAGLKGCIGVLERCYE